MFVGVKWIFSSRVDLSEGMWVNSRDETAGRISRRAFRKSHLLRHESRAWITIEKYSNVKGL